MASVAPLIAQLARQYGLDPSAVIAVARGEGGLVNRPGTQDIGDLGGGGSYGPFQLYARGALPRHLVGNRGAADSWAWSPEGIRYALSKMASSGARGLTGRAAVDTIIRRFERPADPDRSVANAIARLGSSRGRYDQPPNPGQWDDAWNNVQEGRAANKGGRQRELTALRGALGKGPLALIQALQAAGGTPGTPAGGPVSPVQPIQAPIRPGVGGGGFGGMTELIHDPIGSIFDGVQSNKPYGGHDKHVHAAFTNAQSVLRAIALAKRLGLAVTENPYTDPSIGKHADKSHHYRTFPGMYNGRRLGQAVDVSGNPAAMRRFYQSLAARPKK
jgi:hypothetical protein